MGNWGWLARSWDSSSSSKLVYNRSLFLRILTLCLSYVLQMFYLVCILTINVFFLSGIFIFIVKIISLCFIVTRFWLLYRKDFSNPIQKISNFFFF